MQVDTIKERFNRVAQDYDEQRRFFIPSFDDFYESNVAFLSKFKPQTSSILDLGAGTGLLTKYLYSYFSTAQFTLVDVSEQMLQMARKRFDGCLNFRFQVADYSRILPEGDFDMIASALSIHHLDEQEKALLFASVYSKLPHNGIFVNFDIFDAPTKLLTHEYNSCWYDFIGQSALHEKEGESWRLRRELDKENTIAETTSLLLSAGFNTIDVLYKNKKFAVIVAEK